MTLQEDDTHRSEDTDIHARTNARAYAHTRTHTDASSQRVLFGRRSHLPFSRLRLVFNCMKLCVHANFPFKFSGTLPVSVVVAEPLGSKSTSVTSLVSSLRTLESHAGGTTQFIISACTLVSIVCPYFHHTRSSTPQPYILTQSSRGPHPEGLLALDLQTGCLVMLFVLPSAVARTLSSFSFCCGSAGKQHGSAEKLFAHHRQVYAWFTELPMKVGLIASRTERRRIRSTQLCDLSQSPLFLPDAQCFRSDRTAKTR